MADAEGQRSDLFRLFQRSFHPDRSGDVLFVLMPYQFHETDSATTHGSPWQYDRRVPLMVIGNVETARIDAPVSPAAIAPTAARLQRVQPPSMTEEEPLPGVRVAE
jgi:hypothetical protein